MALTSSRLFGDPRSGCAKVNITYKILYNDAVAMTGGQPVDGTISVQMMAQQMAAEGVKRIALVTEDLSRYSDRSGLPGMVTLHDRKDMDAVQRELREIEGATVLIYDQTCAAENAGVVRKDNSLTLTSACSSTKLCAKAVVIAACNRTVRPLCRSRRNLVANAIDQSSCNKDYSCVKGLPQASSQWKAANQ